MADYKIGDLCKAIASSCQRSLNQTGNEASVEKYEADTEKSVKKSKKAKKSRESSSFKTESDINEAVSHEGTSQSVNKVKKGKIKSPRLQGQAASNSEFSQISNVKHKHQNATDIDQILLKKKPINKKKVNIDKSPKEFNGAPKDILKNISWGENYASFSEEGSLPNLKTKPLETEFINNRKIFLHNVDEHVDNPLKRHKSNAFNSTTENQISPTKGPQKNAHDPSPVTPNPSEMETPSLSKRKKLERIRKRMQASLPTKHPDAEKRTIFIGNVSISTKRKHLSKFFSKYGPIETVRIRGIGVEEIGMSKKEAITQNKIHPNRKTVIAFVRFKKLDSVERALEANGQVLNGLHLRVDCAVGGVNKESYSIFIGNLSFEVEDEELWNKFGDCGDITNVRVVRSVSTGAGKGFAFISFKSKDGVELALRMDGELLGGRPMRITRTMKKVKNDSSKPFPRRNAPNRGSMNLSFMKHDKPQLLQEKQKMREQRFQNKQMMRNYAGNRVARSEKAKKFKEKPRMSKDAKRKKYLGRLLTGNS